MKKLRWIAATSISALVTVAVVGAPVSAVGVDQVVSGTVYLEGGQVENTSQVEVVLRGPGGEVVGSSAASFGGYFEIVSGTPLDGDYSLEFYALNIPYASALEYPGQYDLSALPIHLSSGVSVDGVDVELPSMTGASGNVSVGAAYGRGTTVDLIDVRTGNTLHTVCTNTHGDFIVPTDDVLGARVTLKASQGGGSCGQDAHGTYLGGATNLHDADTFLVRPGATQTGLNIALDEPTLVSGEVAHGSPASTDPLPDGYLVTFEGPAGEFSYTQASAAEFVHFAPQGSYLVQVSAPGFASQYYPGVTTRDDAVPVVVGTGAVNLGTITLVEGSTVSGTLSGAATHFLGANVYLLSSDGSQIYSEDYGFVPRTQDPFDIAAGATEQMPGWQDPVSAQVQDNGTFTIANVPDGQYKLYVDGQPLDLPSLYLGGSLFADDATTVSVSGADVNVGTITIDGTGHLGGTIDVDGTTVKGGWFQVLAWALNPASGKWEIVERDDYDGTSPTGPWSYDLPVFAGTYKVSVVDVANFAQFAPGYAGQFVGGGTTAAGSPSVTVASGYDVQGGNVMLTSLNSVSSSRFAGADRYATAVEVSKTFSPGVPVVYVASGENFPDALAAAPAAALAGVPLLTVRHDGIPDVVAAELARLDPDRIVVVGGELSVNAAVFAELGTYAGSGGISRLFGANRYATAQAIVDDVWAGTGPGSNVVWIASGKGFPDALSAAAAAGSVGAPVITVDGSATTLDPAVVQLIQDLGADTVYIAGGFVSVSASLEAQLKGVPGVTTVTRRAGGDRYSTGAAINYYSFDHPTTAYIANGTNFPDALAGAALAGHNNAPLYIVPGACVPAFVVDDLNRMGVTTVNILGGTAAVNIDIHHVTTCP